MHRIIAVANQKGGVGKTTTVINLGASIAAAEKRVLLVDFDPQANCTSGMGAAEVSGGGVYGVLSGDVKVKDAVLATDIPFLSLLPGSIGLAGAEVELASLSGREFVLKNVLELLREDYEYILIDCPPSLGLLTLNALTAADEILIPIQAEFFALEGVGKLLETLDRVREALNPQLAIGGVLLTMVDERTNLSKQVSGEVRRFFSGKVFKVVIPRNVRLAEAPSFGKPAILYDIASRGAQSYLGVAREFLSDGR